MRNPASSKAGWRRAGSLCRNPRRTDGCDPAGSAFGGRAAAPFGWMVSTCFLHPSFHPGSVPGWTTRRSVQSYRFRVIVGSGRKERIMIITVVLLVLVLAAVGYMLVSRMQGRPVNTRRLLVLPAVLAVAGALQLAGVMSAGFRPVDAVLLAAGLLAAAGLGAARGATV